MKAFITSRMRLDIDFERIRERALSVRVVSGPFPRPSMNGARSLWPQPARVQTASNPALEQTRQALEVPIGDAESLLGPAERSDSVIGLEVS